MTFRIRFQTGELRRTASFCLSVLFHGLVISWLVFGPSPAPDEKPFSIYEREIRPNEKRIIWYRLRDRLPDISPAGPRLAAPSPPRALRKFTQTIVAGEKDEPRPAPLIRTPAPEVPASKLPPLPNLVAVTETPRPVRPFARPAAKTAAPATPALPEAPKVATALTGQNPLLATSLAAPVRKFDAPVAKLQTPAVPLLPEAPKVATHLPDQSLLLASATFAPIRKFDVPAARSPTPALPLLPDAPQVVSRLDSQGLTLPQNEFRAPVRAFQTPPSAAPAGLPVSSELLAAPAAPLAVPGAETSLAIVSLNPSKLPEPPAPPGAHDAGFSAGPKPHEGAAPGPSNESAIVVPGLLTRDGASDRQPSLVAGVVPSRQNLMAGLRNPPPPGTPPDPPASHAARVSSAPDPLLAGRVVYSIAIQMPNITSYSGSWMVWFAEREKPPNGAPGEVRPPVPLRKVDPRYVAAAADERVEGVVRLSAVIRKDGRVDTVALVRRLDERLDRSAQDALGRWLFEPAVRNGTPVDVDAIFEVPFRLLPRPAK